MSSNISYWYHPESDSFWIHDPNKDGSLDPNMGDGMSVELTEQEYIKKRIEQIDNSDGHKLPEGISGVIKLAAKWPGESISGMLYYDIHKRFVDGYPINTSPIISTEPGGIYCTKNNKYIVELIEPSREAHIG